MLYLFVAYFGLVTGSFLNLVIYRLHSGESVVRGRSHCPKCGKILSWYELVPVLSFFIQKGRCRGCKDKISWQYPIVEISTTIVFTLVAYYIMGIGDYALTTQVGVQMLFLWVVASALIVIFVYDLRHYLIPDRILFPLILLVLGFRIWDLFVPWNLFFGISESFAGALYSAFIASFLFFLLHFFSKGKALGFGDVKLAFFMGLFLGPQKVVLAVFLGFVLGGIVGIGLIMLKKKQLKSQVPFGPFLILGTYIALFWGEEIINWYLSLIL